jgi:fumarate hydratase class II
MGEDRGMEILDLPVGLDATGTRTETDSLGPVEVPAGRYWGAQTQRALEQFDIGDHRMPLGLIRAYGTLKAAAAQVHARAGRLAGPLADAIGRAAREVAEGALDDEFPLLVWQSGSGTQTHMNVNEVIANRAVQLLGGTLGTKDPVHPNDHVNMGQSTNDTFPAAMHLAAHALVTTRTVPELRMLQDALEDKAEAWADVVKIGRTHLQDATPLTVGQEWSGYAAAVGDATDELERVTDGLLELAIGGTAVGTGLNAPPGFAEEVCAVLADVTGAAFRPASNPFAAQGTLDRMVRAHAALRAVAVSLYKVANDLRWLASGPRAGLGELRLPANEPGSSIMPGKVNPTQAEALLMICMDVMGRDVSVAMAGAEGHFELNTNRPLVISNLLHSATVLVDGVERFRTGLVEGTELDREVIDRDVANSAMLVTALSPEIGYDLAAQVAHRAVTDDLTLREAALALGVDAELFDRVVRPEDMV